MRKLSARAEKSLKEYLRLHLEGKSLDLHRIRNCGIKTAKEIYNFCGVKFPEKIKNGGQWGNAAKEFWIFNKKYKHEN